MDDYLAAIVYGATTGALIFLAACTGWQWMRNKFRGGVLAASQGFIQGLCLLCSGEVLLTGWFTVSRLLDRPEWMFVSDWPLVFRLMILFGAVRVFTSIYPERKYIPALMLFIGIAGVVGALLV